MSKPVISARGLSKAYSIYSSPRDAIMEAVFGGVRHDLFWALRDLSFDVHEGQRIGIVGPNGAGKSTLLKLIAGNLQQTAGSIEVNGRVSAMLSLTSSLDPDRSGVDNVRFNLLLNGARKRDIPELTEEIIEFTELGAFIYAPVRTYSSGMNARLSFAISTALTPDILVVDEVLGAGDAYFAAKATMRMIDLCNRGRALLFVSHAMNAVQLLCDTAIWMDGGIIREIGAVDEIARRYEADFRRQEDAHLREGNAERAALTDTKVLPVEIGRPDVWRLRVTGSGGRVHDTHYVRRIEAVIGDTPVDLPLDFANIDDAGVDACLDVAASEWGRVHDRQGNRSRTLAPGSSLLRGGHIVLRTPLRLGPRELPVVVHMETTSLGKTEQLKVQYADATTGEWRDLVLDGRTKLERGWERASYSGVLRAASEHAHSLHVERVVEETRPDVEIDDVVMLVDGRESLVVRERQPFTIAVSVHAERQVLRADVWLKLTRADGFYVFWQSSGQVGQNLEDFEGTVVVSFHFDPNLFGAGDYEVEVDVADGFDIETNWPHRQVHDRRVGALKFTVAREWRLLMFGAVNYRFPVSVESLKDEVEAPTISVEAEARDVRL